MRLPRLIRGAAAAQGRRASLGRDIALLLAAKIALLMVIRAAFFSDPVLPKMTEGMDPGRVAAAIVAAPAPKP